jgi:hypothetical protein
MCPKTFCLQALKSSTETIGQELRSIPVATVVGMVADGMTEEEILRAFPDLERADIREALQFAAEAIRERELPLLTSS